MPRRASRTEWGIPPAGSGPSSSANLLGMMIGAIFLGGVGDRFGRKRVIVGGTVLYGADALVCLLAENRGCSSASSVS